MLGFHSTLLLYSVLARFAGGMLLLFLPDAQAARAMALWNGLCGAVSFKTDLSNLQSAILPGLSRNPFLLAESIAKVTEQRLLGVASWPMAGQILHQGMFATVSGPFYEELAYRGGAQWLAHRAACAASAVTAASAGTFSRVIGASFFGLGHAFACSDPIELALAPQKVVGTFMSSLLIESRLAHKRKSVWPAVGAHMAFNVISYSPTTRWVIAVPLTSLLVSRRVVVEALGAGARRADLFGGVLIKQLLVLGVTLQLCLRLHRWLCARVVGAIDGALDLEVKSQVTSPQRREDPLT